MATADLNGDHKLDLIVADENDSVLSVLLGNGDGTFQPLTAYQAGSSRSYIAVADFDHDGHLDLASVGINAGSLTLLRGKGNGTFSPPVTIPVGSGTVSLVAGDFNGDKKPDLALGSGAGVTVILNVSPAK